MTTQYHTISELESGVTGLLTGLNINNVQDPTDAFEGALATLLQTASIPEASTADIVTFYDGVYDYLAPVTIFGGALRDIRPLGISRGPQDFVYRKPIERFDRTKAYTPSGYDVTFEMVNGVGLMRVSDSKAIPKIILDPMNQTTGWTAAGTVSNLVADSSFFYESPASLRFTLTGAGTGTLANTLTPSIDLTQYQGVGVVFLALEIPAALLSSVQLQLGSSSLNYYQLSVTKGFLGSFVVGDFTMVAFDLSQATTVGSPVITAMNYINLSFTSTATMTNVRVGSLFISLPSPAKIFYETTAIFQDTNGDISNRISQNTDTILLNDAAYNLYKYECAMELGLRAGGTLENAAIAGLGEKLNGARSKTGAVLKQGLYDLYRAANPAEEVRSIESYYDM
jgi:hypothetical protein